MRKELKEDIIGFTACIALVLVLVLTNVAVVCI